MSVIVLLKDNDRVWAAADSCQVCGSEKSINPHQLSKLWRFSEDPGVLLGAVGACRDGAVFRYSGQAVKKEEITLNKIDTTYVCNVLYKRWMRTLMDQYFLEIPAGHMVGEYFNSAFVLAIGDQGWIVETNGYIDLLDKNKPFIACGSGSTAALSYLKYSKEADPKKKIIAAVRAASKEDAYVDDKIIVCCTEAKK